MNISILYGGASTEHNISIQTGLAVAEAIKGIYNLDMVNLDKEIFMIGDGFTDYEVYSEGIAKAFICYTENIYRENVVELSEHHAGSFDQALEIIRRI